MSKMSKAIAVLGVVAGLGVAALPLSSYAAIPNEGYRQATSAQVEVTVDGAISISSNLDDIDGEGDKAGIITLGEGPIMPGSSATSQQPLEITVSSNNTAAEYSLYIHTTNDGGAMKGKNTGATIPGIGTAGAAATWGYAYSATNDFTSATYEAVPVLADAKEVRANGNTGSTEGSLNETSYFNFKVDTATTTTADTYQATVVFTAVAK